MLPNALRCMSAVLKVYCKCLSDGYIPRYPELMKCRNFC